MATPWFSFSGITGGKKDVTSRIIPWCSWRIYTGLSYLPPYWPIHTAFLGFRPILPTYQMIQQLGFPAPPANHPSNQLLTWSDWPILSACLTQRLLGFLAHPAYNFVYLSLVIALVVVSFGGNFHKFIQIVKDLLVEPAVWFGTMAQVFLCNVVISDLLYMTVFWTTSQPQ